MASLPLFLTLLSLKPPPPSCSALSSHSNKPYWLAVLWQLLQALSLLTTSAGVPYGTCGLRPSITLDPKITAEQYFAESIPVSAWPCLSCTQGKVLG